MGTATTNNLCRACRSILWRSKGIPLPARLPGGGGCVDLGADAESVSSRVLTTVGTSYDPTKDYYYLLRLYILWSSERYTSAGTSPEAVAASILARMRASGLGLEGLEAGLQTELGVKCLDDSHGRGVMTPVVRL